MRGIQRQRFDLGYKVENAKVSDLVDLLKRTYRIPDSNEGSVQC